MTPLRVGVIGCGQISSTYLSLAPLFRTFRIGALADIDTAAAQARGQEFDLPIRSVDQMLVASDIDIILNLTIPAAHAKIARAAIEAGKHVYSEKPLALSPVEGADLVALAEKHNRQIAVAPDTFLGGAGQRARAALDAGRIGEVLAGACHVMSRGPAPWHPNPGFFYQPGGGPVLDMGPYYLTMLVHLLGPVAEVTAQSITPDRTKEVGAGPQAGSTIDVATPTHVNAILRFHSGAQITFTASWDVQAHSLPHLELYGRTGTMRLPDPNHFSGDIVISDATGDYTIPPGAHPFDPDNQASRANYRGVGLADMALATRQAAPPRCSGALAQHVLEVLCTILEACETGRRHQITTQPERPRALTDSAAQELLA